MNLRCFLDFLERFDEQEVNKKSTKSEPKVNQKPIFYEQKSPKKSILIKITFSPFLDVKSIKIDFSD